MGLSPLLSGTRTEDEGLFVRQHAYWAQCMQRAFASDDVADDKVAA
jgi:benzoate/toluate 1,2-dioxygenase alpha subunit